MDTINFQLGTAYDYIYSLTRCYQDVEYYQEDIKNTFDSLQSAFNDPYYQEFAVEFNKGDRIITQLKETISELSKSMLNYAREMEVLANGKA